MTLKLLAEHHFEFLSLKGGCTDSSESTLVIMSHCWKSHVTAHFFSVPLGKQCGVSWDDVKQSMLFLKQHRQFNMISSDRFILHCSSKERFNIYHFEYRFTVTDIHVSK